MTFPNDWKLPCSTSFTIQCTAGCQFTNSGVICDSVKNRLKLTQGFEAGNSYLYGGSPITFIVGDIVNPMTTKTRYISIETIQEVNGQEFGIDKYEGFAFSFTPGDIVVQSIIPTDKMIYSDIGRYNLNFYC